MFEHPTSVSQVPSMAGQPVVFVTPVVKEWKSIRKQLVELLRITLELVVVALGYSLVHPIKSLIDLNECQ
jgi:hypothetical protein